MCAHAPEPQPCAESPGGAVGACPASSWKDRLITGPKSGQFIQNLTHPEAFCCLPDCNVKGHTENKRLLANHVPGASWSRSCWTKADGRQKSLFLPGPQAIGSAELADTDCPRAWSLPSHNHLRLQPSCFPRGFFQDGPFPNAEGILSFCSVSSGHIVCVSLCEGGSLPPHHPGRPPVC